MQELDFSYVSGGGRAENELVFRVRPSDNHAVYRCAASNQMTSQPLNTDLRLTVQCTHPTAPHQSRRTNFYHLPKPPESNDNGGISKHRL